MKILSVVAAPYPAFFNRHNADSHNASFIKGSLKKVVFALSLFALPFAYAHANSASASTEKAVTSKEYRYSQPYTGIEQAVTKGKSDEALPPRAGEQSSSALTSSVSQNGLLAPAPVDTRHIARVEKYTKTTKSSGNTTVSRVNEFWIYDSWVNLQQDLDYDGYFSTFSVEFDADTIFAEVPIYAVLYLGQKGVYDVIHVSSEFVIYGEDSSDSFVIESNLVSGFPSYDYDILLELYDAQTEELVAFSDGYDNAEFAFVPLESETNEYILEDTVVIVEERGGSMSWVALCLLISAVGYRIASRRSSPLE